MKKIILLLLLLLPIYIKAIDTSARSAILMDADNNIVIYKKNINEIRSVASISKIMTAILAIESGKLDDVVTIDDEINKAYGSGIYIKVGEKMTLRDLVYGLMLRSGNDAALAIAHYVSGSVEDFVNLMNKKANELKMTNTLFNNPSGLDEEKGNMSTARDMAILMSYCIKNDEFKTITSTKKYKLTTNKNTYSWTNKNKLLFSYKYLISGKTGFTKIAKRTLVTSASKNDTTFVVVTLNDGDDWNDHKKLFEYGFNNYENIKILSKGNIKIYNEKYYDNYNLYIKHDFSYLIDNSSSKDLVIKYTLEETSNIKNNKKIGEVKIYYLDKLIHTEDIFIKEKANKKENKSFIKKIIDWIKNND